MFVETAPADWLTPGTSPDPICVQEGGEETPDAFLVNRGAGNGSSFHDEPRRRVCGVRPKEEPRPNAAQWRQGAQ